MCGMRSCITLASSLMANVRRTRKGAMKNKIIALSLGLEGSAFALEEYMPVAPNALEVGVAVSPVFMTGSYDGDGEKVDAGGDPVRTGVGVQLKYAVMAGLDVELAWVYATYNEDAGDASGLLQPELGVKYAIGTSGIAVYGNL